MRIGVALTVSHGPSALDDVLDRARALEDAGLDLAWVDERDGGAPPLLVVAALAVPTVGLRLAACVRAGRHPLGLAEEAAVADQCSNGRLILAVADDADDPGLLDETVEVLVAATSARPFRHAGARWTIPAGRPENDGREERIAVTPGPAQPRLPLWLAGTAAHGVAARHGLPRVSPADEDEADALASCDEAATRLGPAARALVRPAIRSVGVAGDGALDADALVERLRGEQRAWGLETAVLRLPPGLSAPAWSRAIGTLARRVRPRLVQDRLPDGLEAHWRAALDDQVRAGGLGRGDGR